MKINTALILCAGLGKRLKPLTLKTPKPLLKLNNKTLLETCINTIIKLGIKKIYLNTFHLHRQIYDFVKSKNFQIEITPARFLNACSREELIEIDLLLQKPMYQQTMREDLKNRKYLEFSPKMLQIFNCNSVQCNCALENNGYPHPDCANFVEDEKP